MDSYRPQRKFVKVMFSRVSVCPQGDEAEPPLGRHPHPGQTPPGQTPTTTPGRHPPWARIPPGHTSPWAHTPTLGRHPYQADTPWADPRHHPGQTPPLGTHPPRAHTHPGHTPTVHVGIQSTSRQYASHWNAFLFIFFLPPANEVWGKVIFYTFLWFILFTRGRRILVYL